MHLEHSADQGQVGRVKAPHLVHPHVDHHDVGQRERKERALALKLLLVLLLAAVGALGGLAAASFGVHHVKRRPKQIVQQRRLAAALPADDGHHVVCTRPVGKPVVYDELPKLVVVFHVGSDDLRRHFCFPGRTPRDPSLFLYTAFPGKPPVSSSS